MKADEIKSGDDLAKYLSEREAEASGLKAVTDTLESQVKAETAKIYAKIEEDAKKADKAFGEITALIKGKWRDSDPQRNAAYGIGKIVQGMMRVKQGGPAASVALKEMGNLGVKMTTNPTPDDWKEDGWEIGGVEKDVGTPLRGDATTGSYLVPTLYGNEVMRVALSNSAMMGKIRRIPMAGRSIVFPAESTMLKFSWPTNEATAKSQATYTFTTATLNCYTAAGYVPISEELNEDSLVPLGEFFRDIFGNAWGKEFDTQSLYANAAPCTGVCYASGINKVYRGSGQTNANGLIPDDLVNLIKALTTQAKRQGACFIAHPTVFDELFNAKDGTGEFILRRDNGEGRPPSILGYPYIECDSMPDINTVVASSPIVVFGNPQRILWGDRVGFEFRIFDNTIEAMQYDRIFLRARVRQGFVTAVPSAFAVLFAAAA
jgi:HK97 family phage major capsid protein